MENKKQLHQSQLQQLFRCGEKFYRKYILGHKEASAVHLIVGSTTHNTASDNLNQKIASGGLKEEAEIKDITRDHFIKNWQESPVCFDKEEKEMGIEKVKGAAIDQSIVLSVLHHRELAPSLSPVAVERKWVVECAGYPFDLSGTIDVEEEKYEHKAVIVEPQISAGTYKKYPVIRDLKTAKKNPGQREADNSEQLTMYALAKYIIDKVMPEELWLDTLVKTKEPYLISHPSTRTTQDFQVAKLRFERACKIIDAGAFAPASRSDWWCSPAYCGYAADESCPFYNHNKQQFAVTTPQIKQSKSTPKKIIKSTDKEWNQ